MANYTVETGQNIFDVAVKALGSVTRAYDLLKANGLSVNTDLFAGQILVLPDEADLISPLSKVEKKRILFFAERPVSRGDFFYYQIPEFGDFNSNDFNGNDFLT